MTFSTTITVKGQMTLPAAFRRKLGIKPGERLLVNLKGNTVTVQKDDWQASLRKMQAKNRLAMQQRHIPVLNDNELNQAIDRAAEQAAVERYRRSLA